MLQPAALRPLRPDPLQRPPELICVHAALSPLTPGAGQSPELDPSSEGKDRPRHQQPEGIGGHGAHAALNSGLARSALDPSSLCE